MPGVKGRSGGARPNSGGKRAGAGRKSKAKVAGEQQSANSVESVPQGDVDMLKLLQNVALGVTKATALQVRAAIAAVQYTHTKRGDGGKKEEVAAKAKNAAGGKFGVRRGPLKLVGGGG